MFDIQQELKKLPAKPGVYLMHNSKDEIIYVGKAIKLCNRVRQYFQDSRNLSVKIQHMVKNVAYFEYIITDSELEALVLENNLIKEHHPKYNTKLKDDKGYPYIKVTVNEEFPRIMLARKMKADGGKYFGPYTSAGAVNDTIELLRKIFKIRTCNRRLPKDTGKDRPCLYYQIKQCDAPCQGYISKEEYAKQIEETIKFLNGNYKQVAKMLQEKMQKHRMNWNLNRRWNTEICSRVLSGSWTVRRSIRMRLRTVTLLQWHRMIRMLSYLFSLSAKESFLEENIFIWKQMRKVQRKKF